MRQSHRSGDGVLALLALGIWLLMPPVIPLFAGPVKLFGVPLLVLYLFGVWLLLILGSCFLAHRLPREQGRRTGSARRAGEPD